MFYIIFIFRYPEDLEFRDYKPVLNKIESTDFYQSTKYQLYSNWTDGQGHVVNGIINTDYFDLNVLTNVITENNGVISGQSVGTVTIRLSGAEMTINVVNDIAEIFATHVTVVNVGDMTSNFFLFGISSIFLCKK